MRSHRQPTVAFRGQILFAECREWGVVLDCVLTRDPEGPGNPLTLLLRLPGEAAAEVPFSPRMLPLKFAGRALTLVVGMNRLKAWAESGERIAVEVEVDGSRAEVHLRGPDGELLLEPEDRAQTSL